MTTARLKAEHRKAFANDGYVVVPSVVSRTQCLMAMHDVFEALPKAEHSPPASQPAPSPGGHAPWPLGGLSTSDAGRP